MNFSEKFRDILLILVLQHIIRSERQMSKNVVLAIAGVLFGWLIIRLFTKEFSSDYLITLLLGFMLGYIVKKQEKVE